MPELSDEFYQQLEASRSIDHQLIMIMNVILGGQDEFTTNSFGVLLLSNGTPIRGTVITRYEYQRLQVEVLNADESAGAQHLGTVLDGVFAELNKLLANRENNKEVRRSRRWVHLRDAETGYGESTIRTSLLRVSLDSIDAWSLGN